jgi:hypothetical protein
LLSFANFGFFAGVLAASAVVPPKGLPPLRIADQSCPSRIANFVRQYAPRHPRFVFTFTGSQSALLPLWEAAGGPHSENAFFPVGREAFVLTMTYRATNPQIDLAESFAAMMCGLGTSKGGRYNGAIAYLGNDMIGADLSELPRESR